jgi:predicted DNA-binding transcriptional regulator YafY
MPFPANRLGPDPRISSRRAARLYRLLTELNESSRSRPQLIRLGRAGMRTFYRDLTLLAEYGIDVRMSEGRYELVTPLREALARLPFPPPELSFGDVLELTKGRGTAQSKLRAQLDDLTG